MRRLSIYIQQQCAMNKSFSVNINSYAPIQAFAKEGAQVTATDINGEKLKELDGIPGDSQYWLDI